MKERLSSSTVRENAIALVLSLVAVVVAIWLLIAGTPHWLALCFNLPIFAATIYQTTFYQITLTTNTILIEGLYGRPVSYSLLDFVEMQQTQRPYRSLRIRFTDGKTFLFSPKLKESSFSLRYTPPADFIEYWTEEIIDCATVLPK